MGFNVYLGPLVKVEGATSISTILLIDVDVESFSPYIYVLTPQAKHTKTIRRAPSLEIPRIVNYNFLSFCRRRPTPTTCPARLHIAIVHLQPNDEGEHTVIFLAPFLSRFVSHPHQQSGRAHLAWFWNPIRSFLTSKINSPISTLSRAPSKPADQAQSLVGYEN